MAILEPGRAHAGPAIGARVRTWGYGQGAKGGVWGLGLGPGARARGLGLGPGARVRAWDWPERGSG